MAAGRFAVAHQNMLLRSINLRRKRGGELQLRRMPERHELHRRQKFAFHPPCGLVCHADGHIQIPTFQALSVRKRVTGDDIQAHAWRLRAQRWQQLWHQPHFYPVSHAEGDCRFC
ncbi:hypothetical protein D3C75_955800 [compost metagenome]